MFCFWISLPNRFDGGGVFGLVIWFVDCCVVLVWVFGVCVWFGWYLSRCFDFEGVTLVYLFSWFLEFVCGVVWAWFFCILAR